MGYKKGSAFKSPRDYDYPHSHPEVNKEKLDQYFGKKKKVIVITTDEPVDEVIIKFEK